MAPRIPKAPKRRQDYGFPPDDGYTTPPDTTTTVLLKTLMEVKETLGAVKSDLSQLKDTVSDVKTKQSDLDKTLAAIKTIFKTVVFIASTVATFLGLVKYWDQIMNFVKLMSANN